MRSLAMCGYWLALDIQIPYHYEGEFLNNKPRNFNLDFLIWAMDDLHVTKL